MPLYMDVHRDLKGVNAEDVARAHVKDLEVEKKYGVHYHKYFFNGQNGSIFCLVEGPDKDACERVHREAHGLVADDLIEVEPRLVEAFLGTPTNFDGAAVFDHGEFDTGVRIVLFTQVANYAEVAALADQSGVRIMQSHDRIVREVLAAEHGHEIRHTGEGIMACFPSVVNGLSFAEQVQSKCAEECGEVDGHKPELRIGIAAGEPVESNRELFGVSVTTARRICELAPPGGVLVSGAVRELAVGKGFRFVEHDTVRLAGVDDDVTLFALQRPQLAAPPAAAPVVRPKPRRVIMIREFWQELKRRHVVTVGAVYLAALFGMLQVAQLTFDTLGLPEWAYTFVLVVGIFGLPLALVLAWAFDMNVSRDKD